MNHKIPLPRGWKRRVRSSVLHILALSHYTFTAMLARAANQRNHRVRLQAEWNSSAHAGFPTRAVIFQAPSARRRHCAMKWKVTIRASSPRGWTGPSMVPIS